jgi:hypothetical protein
MGNPWHLKVHVFFIRDIRGSSPKDPQPIVHRSPLPHIHHFPR